MRGSVWLTASVLALALAACSPKAPSAPAPPAPPSEPAPPPSAASAPGPDNPQAAPPTPENAAPTATPAAGLTASAAEAPYRFSPGDFPKQEHRIAGLIANAETRDTSGETASVAAQGQRARERCATRKCVAAAYAAEEARLRKWEGSGDVR